MRLVLRAPAPTVMAKPQQALTMQARVDLLPEWARRMHGLPAPALARPLARASMFGVAQTLPWAFA